MIVGRGPDAIVHGLVLVRGVEDLVVRALALCACWVIYCVGGGHRGRCRVCLLCFAAEIFEA